MLASWCGVLPCLHRGPSSCSPALRITNCRVETYFLVDYPPSTWSDGEVGRLHAAGCAALHGSQAGTNGPCCTKATRQLCRLHDGNIAVRAGGSFVTTFSRRVQDFVCVCSPPKKVVEVVVVEKPKPKPAPLPLLLKKLKAPASASASAAADARVQAMSRP